MTKPGDSPPMSEPVTSNGDATEQSEVRREPIFNLPGVVVVLVAICTLIHVLRMYVLSTEQDLALLVNTAFVPVFYSGRFDIDISSFISPFTYAFLHGSFLHLAVNMIWLAAFGSPLANRLGVVRFLLFWAFTSLCAALLHYVLHMTDQSPLIGASGAISGMMGAAARFGFQIDRRSGKTAFAGRPMPVAAVFRSRSAVTFLAVWMVVNLVTGLVSFAPGVDDVIAWEAHIGGFLAGFLCIDWFDRQHRGDGADTAEPG
jgi:membrane associated rhomboid family serine protease